MTLFDTRPLRRPGQFTTPRSTFAALAAPTALAAPAVPTAAPPACPY